MTVLNKYRHAIPSDAVDIMRPGPLGNPFTIGRHGTRDEVCDAHMRWAREGIAKSPAFADMIRRLHGKDLKCCCKPLRCHGDNYVLLAAELQA